MKELKTSAEVGGMGTVLNVKKMPVLLGGKGTTLMM